MDQIHQNPRHQGRTHLESFLFGSYQPLFSLSLFSTGPHFPSALFPPARIAPFARIMIPIPSISCCRYHFLPSSLKIMIPISQKPPNRYQKRLHSVKKMIPISQEPPNRYQGTSAIIGHLRKITETSVL